MIEGGGNATLLERLAAHAVAAVATVLRQRGVRLGNLEVENENEATCVSWIETDGESYCLVLQRVEQQTG